MSSSEESWPDLFQTQESESLSGSYNDSIEDSDFLPSEVESSSDYSDSECEPGFGFFYKKDKNVDMGESSPSSSLPSAAISNASSTLEGRDTIGTPSGSNRRHEKGGDLSLGERSEPGQSKSSTLSCSGATSGGSAREGVVAKIRKKASLHQAQGERSPSSLMQSADISNAGSTHEGRDTISTPSGNNRRHGEGADLSLGERSEPGQSKSTTLSCSGATSSGSAREGVVAKIRKKASLHQALGERSPSSLMQSADISNAGTTLERNAGTNLESRDTIGIPSGSKRRHGKGADLSLGERSELGQSKSIALSGSGVTSSGSAREGVAAKKPKKASLHKALGERSPASSTSSAGKRQKTKAATKRLKMNCPECNFEIFNLKRHYIQWHNLSENQAKSKLKQYHKKKIVAHNRSLDLASRSGRLYKDCPMDYCMARVKRLDHHMKDVHGLDSSSPRYSLILNKAHREARRQSNLIRQARERDENLEMDREEEVRGEGERENRERHQEQIDSEEAVRGEGERLNRVRHQEEIDREEAGRGGGKEGTKRDIRRRLTLKRQ
ncbi:damage suppressor protein-like [Ptychodera flava]|uniref:damage suppressor protein-like n=1 Tax=Ptychodera flava TaxID=63121 RepID=UPI00396A0BDC